MTNFKTLKKFADAMGLQLVSDRKGGFEVWDKEVFERHLETCEGSPFEMVKDHDELREFLTGSVARMKEALSNAREARLKS